MMLRDLFDKHGSDKGSRHGYERAYEPILESIRHQELSILEVGVFKGAGTAAWMEYFPNARFFGIDIFERVAMEDIVLAKDPRVKWFKCDSTKPTPAPFLQAAKDKFDIIIDDGLHTHPGQLMTFKNLIGQLKVGGHYFIEDVFPFGLMTPEEKRDPWLLENEGYTDWDYAKLIEAVSEYGFELHDLRDGYQLDSFIIEVRK